jgi:DNA mismatch endonuclease (patch repair protein)
MRITATHTRGQAHSMDKVPPAKRSWIMSRIRSGGTKPELVLREIVRDVLSSQVGRRTRIIENDRRLFGTPDVHVPSLSLVFFVDGCFFHSCPSHCRIPKSNVGYWVPKLAANIRRDRRNSRNLRGSGYSVWRFWEHDMVRQDRVRARISVAVQKAVARITESG